jgi:signal transduction histidine kinase
MWTKINALREELAQASTPETRLPLMAQLARFLARNSITQSEAENLANQILMAVKNDETALAKEYSAEAWLVLSEVEEWRDNLPQAFRLSSQAQDIFKALGYQQKLLQAYHISGYQAFLLGDHITGLRIAYEQLELAIQLDNKEFLCGAYNVLGLMFSHRKNYVFALKQFHQSLDLSHTLDDKHYELHALSNLAQVSLEMHNFESAISYALAGLVTNEKVGNMPMKIILILHIGSAYYEQGLYDKALEYAQQAHAMVTLGNMGDVSARVLLLLGKIFARQGDFERASETLLMVLTLVEQSGNNRQLTLCYDELSRLYEQKGDFASALLYARAHQDAQKNWFDELSATTIENLRVIHEVNQSEREAEKERRLREEDRRYFQHLAQMKEAVISTASHDLKNPLTSLKLNLDLLRKHGQLNDERGQRFLRRIEGSVSHMRKLITDLLDMAQLETGRALKMETVEVISFVEYILDSFEVLAEQRYIRLVFEHPNDLHEVSFDPRRMSQVLDNLISNAIKYSPLYGEIILKLTFVNDEMNITVHDHGIGIPEDDLPRIFDQFYRVSNQEHATYEGTGLGLAIAKTIVEQHNGRIWVKSERGKGSVFGFAVPAILHTIIPTTTSV